MRPVAGSLRGANMLLIHAFISWVCGSRASLLLSFSVVFLFVFFIHLYITFWSSVYPFCRVRHPFLFFVLNTSYPSVC